MRCRRMSGIACWCSGTRRRRRIRGIALVYEAEQLSYAQLKRRANQLAHHLRSMGVGPDQRVGLCVERSIELVVGLLGILKAGAAYVPLDPTYPTERLAYLLRDSEAVALLTQARFSGLASSVQSAQRAPPVLGVGGAGARR